MKWDANRCGHFVKLWNEGLDREALGERFGLSGHGVASRVRVLRAEGWPLKSRGKVRAREWSFRPKAGGAKV